jgi:hypothetical protein
MATVGITLTAQMEGLRELQDALGRTLQDNPAKTKLLAAAIEKAIQPVEMRLREVSPVGPTGNLKRAVTSKVVEYGLDGVAVGIVGYRRAGRADSSSAAGGSVRAGPDRAFHQWWLENGTQGRMVMKPADKPYTRLGHVRRMKSGKTVDVVTHEVKRQGGYIASSYNRLGEFRMLKTPRMPRGQEGQRVQTDPGYPNAYFKKSSTPISIPAMPVGGSTGRPPLQTAFNQTQARVAEILQRELRLSLEQALATLTRSATGTVG